MNFDEEMKLANILAKKVHIDGAYSHGESYSKGQEKIRRIVIDMWNNGESMAEIAVRIKKPVKYVRNYIKLFTVIYGEEIVEQRRITHELPQA